MADKKSFVMYTMWEPMVEALSEEDAGRLMKAVFAYTTCGDTPADCDRIYPMFALIKAQIDLDSRKYEERCEKNAENGSRGGRPKNQTKPNKSDRFSKKQSQAKKADTDPDIDPDSDTEPEKLKKSGRMERPTRDQVRSYCQERRNGINPDAFVDYYESNGWRVGKNPMKDWKACIRRWECSEKEHPPNSAKTAPVRRNGFNGFADQHRYDFDELEKVLGYGGGYAANDTG